MSVQSNGLLRYVRARLRGVRHRSVEARLTLNARASRRHRLHSGATRRPFVASLTSYGSRQELAHMAIETLMQQTVQPEHLVLWVSDTVKVADLSPALQNQVRRGLEIRPVPDIGPYTKVIPSLEAFPDRPILTVDDDSFYAPNLFERLYEASAAEPRHVHCYRAHRMLVDEEGWPLPYNQWENRTSQEVGPSFLLFPTGVGGVIYPPGTLHKEVLNRAVFRKLCPIADDVWLKAMALLNGTMAKRLPGVQRDFPVASRSQQNGLKQANVAGERNDQQIREVFQHYALNRMLKELKAQSCSK